MIRKIIIVTLVLIVFTGCAGIQPIQKNKGNKVVCVLFKDTRFKTEVVGNLTKQLALKGYTVVTGSVKQAKYYNAADYAAVVYMAELWAWHTPFHAKKYFRKHNEANTIVFVITSGDPDVTITKPFDAVTSASAPDKVEPVAHEIMGKLSNMLK
ncbi:hypothetical protein ACFL60_02210 [Candidatus Omnitrophota bacterium]